MDQVDGSVPVSSPRSGEMLSEHRVFREVGSLDVATPLAWSEARRVPPTMKALVETLARVTEAEKP